MLNDEKFSVNLMENPEDLCENFILLRRRGKCRKKFVRKVLRENFIWKSFL
jgi:hypothetical protein